MLLLLVKVALNWAIVLEPYETNYAPELIYASTKVTSHIGTNVTLTCIFSGR